MKRGPRYWNSVSPALGQRKKWTGTVEGHLVDVEVGLRILPQAGAIRVLHRICYRQHLTRNLVNLSGVPECLPFSISEASETLVSYDPLRLGPNSFGLLVLNGHSSCGAQAIRQEQNWDPGNSELCAVSPAGTTCEQAYVL